MAHEFLLNGPLNVPPLCGMVFAFYNKPKFEGICVRQWDTNNPDYDINPGPTLGIADAGEVYAVHNGKIRVFSDSDGVLKRTHILDDDDNDELDFPICHRVLIQKGEIFLLGMDSDDKPKLQVLREEDFVLLRDLSGSGLVDVNFPVCLAILPGDRIAIADHEDNRIKVIEKDGTLVRMWEVCISPEIKRPPDFAYFWCNRPAPYDIVYYEKEIYVLCAGCCVEVFDTDGNFLRVFGSFGLADNQLCQASEIAVSAIGVFIV